MTLPLNKTVLYVRNIFISLRSRTEKPLLFQAIQFVSTKPKENEHIMTPQYWLPDSWDKGECLIAGFQTKPTQLRTRVCVKEVLKGNITHSSTATKEHWNSLQNSLFFHYSKWRGGKKIPQTHKTSLSLSYLEYHILVVCTSMLIFNEFATRGSTPLPGFKDSLIDVTKPCMRTLPHWPVSKPFVAKSIYYRARSIIQNPSEHHS